MIFTEYTPRELDEAVIVEDYGNGVYEIEFFDENGNSLGVRTMKLVDYEIEFTTDSKDRTEK